jgi:catechol 2,3-dioxygenase-like lactoylglutathione lyase family enzyme
MTTIETWIARSVVIGSRLRGNDAPIILSEDNMASLNGVLETALYVDDIERARRFYEDVLGLASIYSDARLRAYAVGGRSVLLLFQRGSSVETVHMPGGTIPPHDGSGPLHIAFAISADELSEWEERLRRHEVAIEGRTDWRRGGKSIYFRDPDGHLLEVATPGLWSIY